MAETTSVRCYIEEYGVESERKFRLREKNTRRKVNLGATTEAGLVHFIEFVSAAAANRAIMPDLFESDGDLDAIVVTGHVGLDTPEELGFKYDQQLSYIYG